MVTFNYAIWWGLVGIHQRMAAVLLEPFPTPLLGFGGFGIQSPDRDRAGILDLGRNKSPFWHPQDAPLGAKRAGDSNPDARDSNPGAPGSLSAPSGLLSLDFWTPLVAPSVRAHCRPWIFCHPPGAANRHNGHPASNGTLPLSL